VTVNSAPITQTINLPGGPFAQVVGTGVTLTVFNQSLTGNFAFQQMKNGTGQTVTVLTADHVTLDLGGSSALVHVTNGHGHLLVTADGIAGSLSATVTLNLPGSASFEGTFGITLNNTHKQIDPQVTINGQQVPSATLPTGPYVQVSGTGVVLHVGGQTLQGDF